jgi:hypothetical protein
MISMDITFINPSTDLSAVVHVLNVSHGTVAKDFGFTRDSNPTNNAFIDESTLRAQLNKGIDLYAISSNSQLNPLTWPAFLSPFPFPRVNVSFRCAARNLIC